MGGVCQQRRETAGGRLPRVTEEAGQRHVGRGLEEVQAQGRMLFVFQTTVNGRASTPGASSLQHPLPPPPAPLVCADIGRDRWRAAGLRRPGRPANTLHLSCRLDSPTGSRAPPPCPYKEAQRPPARLVRTPFAREASWSLCWHHLWGYHLSAPPTAARPSANECWARPAGGPVLRR